VNIRPIKSEADYEASLKAIDARMDAAPGTAEEAELDVLSTLVDAYEEKRFPIDAPDPISAIQFRWSRPAIRRRTWAHFSSRRREPRRCFDENSRGEPYPALPDDADCSL
jgi:antitoxin component HigA of HigAB toxin-antitoxin module